MTTTGQIPEPQDGYYSKGGVRLPRVSTVLDMLGDSAKSDSLRDWAGYCAKREAKKLLRQKGKRVNAATADEVCASIDEKAIDGQWRVDLAMYAEAGTYAHELIERSIMARMVETGLYKAEDLAAKGLPKTRGSVVTNYAQNAAENWLRWCEQAVELHGFEPIAAEQRLVSSQLGYGGTVDCVAQYKGGTWVLDWKTSSAIDATRYSLQGVAYAALQEEEAGRTVDGVLIVRCDRRHAAWDVLEVPVGRFAALWSVWEHLLHLHSAKTMGVI